jgi:hypothetical protein
MSKAKRRFQKNRLKYLVARAAKEYCEYIEGIEDDKPIDTSYSLHSLDGYYVNINSGINP